MSSYKEDLLYTKLLDFLSKKLNVSTKAIEGYNENTIIDGFHGKIAKNGFIAFFLFLLFPIILFVSLLKKNRVNHKESDILLEEWRDDSFPLYYEKILSTLKGEKKITRLLYMKRVYKNFDSISQKFHVLKLDDYIDKKIILKIVFLLIFSPRILYSIFILTIKYNMNFSYLFLKLFSAFMKFKSVAKNSNTKIYLSANDINSHLIKYEIFQQMNIKYVLIQSALRERISLLYKGADTIYCFSEHQSKLYKDKTNDFKNIVAKGSLKCYEYSQKEVSKRYDILFVEQYGDRSNVEYGSNESYIIMLSHLIKLSYEYPSFKIIYRTRKEKRDERTDIKVYDEVLSELEKSNIIIDTEGSSYEKVKKSKLVVGYYSTLCFESIGLDVPTLFYYYDNYKYEIFDYENSEDDILILDESYEKFKSSILKKLESNDHSEYLKKYKKIYMNQDKLLVNLVLEEMEGYF